MNIKSRVKRAYDSLNFHVDLASLPFIVWLACESIFRITMPSQMGASVGRRSVLNTLTLFWKDNRIEEIEGLEGLGQLRKLELGDNRIVALTSLAPLTSIVHLSLENNHVTSLEGKLSSSNCHS